MTLVSINEIASLLICPRCRAGLSRVTSDNYACMNEACEYAGVSSFPVIANRPVLVDFNQSILSENEIIASAGVSVVERAYQSGARRKLKEFIFPPNLVARDNVRRMRALLKAERALDGTPPLILVVGGGTIGSGVEELYEDADVRLVGFDIYVSPLVQFVADAHRIPLGDASVDGVLVQAVLEHVLEPWRVVAELHRVLKPEGIVYAETPFMQQVHEGAFDFTRFTESGHRYLFKQFTLIDSGVVAGSGTQLSWTIDYLSGGIFRHRGIGKVVKALFFWVQYLDRVIPERYGVDNASGVFFLGRRCAHAAVAPRDMVAHYKGAQKKRCPAAESIAVRKRGGKSSRTL